jgi:hypothetical protein
MYWLPNNVSSVILILFIIYVFVRLEQFLRLRKEERRLTRIRSDEINKYNKEAIAKAHANRDEQLRLLGEILQNQREILDVLKRQAKDT